MSGNASPFSGFIDMPSWGSNDGYGGGYGANAGADTRWGGGMQGGQPRPLMDSFRGIADLFDGGNSPSKKYVRGAAPVPMTNPEPLGDMRSAMAHPYSPSSPSRGSNPAWTY